MKTSELDYSYPDSLIATTPQFPPRVMRVENGEPREISWAELLAEIPSGDLLVINETKVLKRRVFAAGGLEILFLKPLVDNPLSWEVLFPARSFGVGASFELPFGMRMTLVQKGRPQIVETERELTEADFERAAELPLPPYIQKARGERHNQVTDGDWYQTRWARKPGSLAAPTASLHFRGEDIDALRARGVGIVPITLHVGLGTFLPVTSDDLDQHQMHFERVEISGEAARTIAEAQAAGRGIWALGTTVARSLESAAGGKLKGSWSEGFAGETDLLIQPGCEWKVVTRLLTNFHQPKSTLIALVAAFAGLKEVKACYAWAVERRFRLFSYGDFSLWIR